MSRAAALCGAMVRVRSFSAAAATVLVLPAAASAACGLSGYSYAGFEHARTARGIRASLVAIARPDVESGHVAAWVGVGGPGLGAGGSDAWIQVGLDAFRGTGSKLYFEVNQPSAGLRYTELADGIAEGARYQVAVLEIAGRAGWWRVWVNGDPASAPLYLPGSSGRWRPVATAETWDGGRPACNRFAYRFEDLAVATRPGGSWTHFVAGGRFEDPGYRLLLQAANTFVARAAGWSG
jgi:hypothetical protein